MAQLLRADLLPEAWIAPAKVRQPRALLRHRISLVRLGTGLRNRIHAVAADHGYGRPASYRAGPGRGWLAELDLPPASREIATDCLAVTGGLAPLTGRPDGGLRQWAKAGPRVKALRTLPGRRGVHRAGHPRSSSPLRGCARSSLTPPARWEDPGSCEENPEEQSGQPGDST